MVRRLTRGVGGSSAGLLGTATVPLGTAKATATVTAVTILWKGQRWGRETPIRKGPTTGKSGMRAGINDQYQQTQGGERSAATVGVGVNEKTRRVDGQLLRTECKMVHDHQARANRQKTETRYTGQAVRVNVQHKQITRWTGEMERAAVLCSHSFQLPASSFLP